MDVKPLRLQKGSEGNRVVSVEVSGNGFSVGGNNPLIIEIEMC
jgi:hypothetical protein